VPPSKKIQKKGTKGEVPIDLKGPILNLNYRSSLFQREKTIRRKREMTSVASCQGKKKSNSHSDERKKRLVPLSTIGTGRISGAQPSCWVRDETSKKNRGGSTKGEAGRFSSTPKRGRARVVCTSIFQAKKPLGVGRRHPPNLVRTDLETLIGGGKVGTVKTGEKNVLSSLGTRETVVPESQIHQEMVW